MKKLMIAAAIVCAAAMSQAAQATWMAGDIYDFKGPTTTVGAEDWNDGSYLVYFIDSYMVDETAYGYTRDQAMADIADGKLDFLTTYGQQGVNDEGAVGKTVVPTTFGSNQSIDGYVVVLNSDTIADATYAYVSAVQTKSTGPEGQTAGFSLDTSSSQVGSNWVQVAPEPTSGLLLLIGVAGLALRRRRA